MRIVTQSTLFHSDLWGHVLLGKPYRILPNTSLNEKFSVLANEPMPENDYPTLQYFCIGIGGNQIVDDNNNLVYSEHSPLDGALFKHIPFALKPISADLNPEERANYRLRVVENIEGTEYAAYYLKKITGSNIPDYFRSIKTISTGHDVSTPKTAEVYSTDYDILNPKPSLRKFNIDNLDQLEYLANIYTLELQLSIQDFINIGEVIKIKKLDGAILTELGLCTGLEKKMSSYTEAIGVQIAFHFAIDIEIVKYIKEQKSFSKTIELGGSEPLIG